MSTFETKTEERNAGIQRTLRLCTVVEGRIRDLGKKLDREGITEEEASEIVAKIINQTKSLKALQAIALSNMTTK